MYSWVVDLIPSYFFWLYCWNIGKRYIGICISTSVVLAIWLRNT